MRKSAIGLAVAALSFASAARADDPGLTVVSGRWSTTVYGVAKLDAAYDTTQSFSDLAGAGQVARPDGHPPPPPAAPITFAGDHGRTQLSMRDSKLGLRIKAPETGGVAPTALLEMDFFGTLPSTATESQIFASPIPRLRHAYVKLETPIVDVLAGQTWHLFGWQSTYFPSSVQAQGIPGQLYSRTPQLRVSKKLGTSAIEIEAAVAMMRPPARDSVLPELEGGVRVALPFWTGLTTAGMAQTSIQPASVAASVDVRDVTVPEFSPLPKATVEKSMASIALDAFVPVIPATDETRGNSLSLTGELVFGHGTADLYTNASGGMQFPVVANRTGLNPPPTYPQNIDNGIVVFDLYGDLHEIQWTTLLVGAQYYLPRLEGRAWIAANYAHMESSNPHFYTRPFAATLPDPQSSYYVSEALVRDSLDFVDVSLLGEPLPGLRVGLEGAVTIDHYVDKVRAVNHRLQLGTLYAF